jgi:D-serine dehydratase
LDAGVVELPKHLHRPQKRGSSEPKNFTPFPAVATCSKLLSKKKKQLSISGTMKAAGVVVGFVTKKHVRVCMVNESTLVVEDNYRKANWKRVN